MFRFRPRCFTFRAVHILILAGVVCAFAPLRADLIYFRNSKYAKGKVIERSPSHVYFRTEDGLQIEIPVKMIRKIIVLDEKEEQRLALAAAREKELREKEAERRRAAMRAEDEIRRAREDAERRIALARERAEMAEMRRRVDRLVAEKLDRAWKLRAGAAKRSAVLPGWGQHYMNRPGAGWAFNLAIALTALYTFGAYRDLQAAERDFARIGPPALLANLPEPDGFTPSPAGPVLASVYLDEKEAVAGRELQRVNLGLLLMLMTWGWNLYDVLNAEAPARIESDTALMQGLRFSFSSGFRRSSDTSMEKERRFSVQTGFRF